MDRRGLIVAGGVVVALVVSLSGWGCSGGDGASTPGAIADGGTDPSANPAAEGGIVWGLAYPLTLTPLSSAKTKTANVTLFFSVKDANGNGVPNLSCSSRLPTGDAGTACDFKYLEDGNPLDPTESAFDVQPVPAGTLKMPTVLVLQTSPSIIQNGELGALKEAASAIVNGLLPQQTLEIMTFADAVTPNVRIPFTNDKAALNAAVAAISGADGTSTNLYGTLDYGLNEWTDGFSPSGNGELTAGLLIVITNGSDNAARRTLDSVVQARGNKRVIAIGIGTDQTLDTCALNAIGNERVIVKPTYDQLRDGIDEVTKTVQTLGSSIYTASYCSPKRASETGANTHQLTFTVRGNENYNASVCSNAVFTPAQDSVCTGASTSDGASKLDGGSPPAPAPKACSVDGGAGGGQIDSTETCGLNANTGYVMCCPADKPYGCPTSQEQCYRTAVEAATACQGTCVLCGGTGKGAGQDNQLVPGTQIVVPFNSSGYASGQCPALWGAQCTTLKTCCDSNQDPVTGTSCEAVVEAALGDEPTCTARLATYCPTRPNCAALSGCCAGLLKGSSEQADCYSDMISAGGLEATCATYTPRFGSYNPAACPLGPRCKELTACCAALPTASGGEDLQANCQSRLQETSGDESACAATTASFGAQPGVVGAACPLGPNCTQMRACCTALPAGSTAAATCASDFEAVGGDEASCARYTPTFSATNSTACPLGPECKALGQCCPTLTGSSATSCKSYVSSAGGNESSCTSYLSGFAGSPGCVGPNCTALTACCNTLAGSGRAACLSSASEGSTEASCLGKTHAACPTTPNCAALKAACEVATGSARDTCETALLGAGASESSCAQVRHSMGAQGSAGFDALN